MSGVAILRELLSKHAPVTQIVTAPRNIVAGILPQNTTVPALSVHQISGYEFQTVARLSNRKQIRERVQVTALARDYPTMKKLLKATALGKGVKTGIVLGFQVLSILPDYEGPEIPPGDDGIYEQSRDFMVTFVEAN